MPKMHSESNGLLGSDIAARPCRDPDVEIVALVGKSLDTLKQTHPRYFNGDELPAEPATAAVR
jgi:hypothetical protein